MKLFMLVIITTWSFYHPYPKPKYAMVRSEEKAAWIVYCVEKSRTYPEPNQYAYRLYEIDFETETMKQINIPKIEFKGGKI